ncbi:hypothetical protein SAMN05216428_11750 [Nitrosospira sp. Nsp11]|nr:hypothetical protein SAMN05216428_11750 [Nitrosospira sp. Nsp11]
MLEAQERGKRAVTSAAACHILTGDKHLALRIKLFPIRADPNKPPEPFIFQSCESDKKAKTQMQ